MVDVTFPDEPWADVEEGTEALLKRIVGNKFVRHHPAGFGPRKPVRTVRDDGTYPRSEVRQFSLECFWHPVPANWRERSVVEPPALGGGISMTSGAGESA